MPLAFTQEDFLVIILSAPDVPNVFVTFKSSVASSCFCLDSLSLKIEKKKYYSGPNFIKYYTVQNQGDKDLVYLVLLRMSLASTIFFRSSLPVRACAIPMKVTGNRKRIVAM